MLPNEDSSYPLQIIFNFMTSPLTEPKEERWEFPPTRWSLVLGAQSESDEQSRTRALSDLCEMYWYPLYAFVRRRGLAPSDAEDVTQGFFCELIGKDRVQLFSESKGKLRAYLLSSVKNYLKDLRKYEGAVKRGGGVKPLSLEFEIELAEERYAAEPAEFDTPEKLFEMRWSMTILERVFRLVESEYERLGKSDVFQALKGNLAGDGDVSFREISENSEMSEGSARVALFRMRKQYRKILEAEISQTLAEGESVEEEIEYLTNVFNR